MMYTPIEQIPVIVEKARNAFNNGTTKSKQWRLQQLKQIKKLITENLQMLHEALRKDLNGSGAYLSTETTAIIPDIDHVIFNLDSWMAPESISTPLLFTGSSSKIVKDPLGVVLVIGAWNFPFTLVFRPLIGAIAAGNAVVIKPSEVAENSSQIVLDLFPKYLDKNAIQVVTGGVDETSALLDKRFDKILYTGNGTVGKIVLEKAAKHLTPVILELGGKSPVIIDKDVDIEKAAPRIALGKFSNAGQICIAPDYALVHKDRVDDFVKEMKKNITKFFGDDPKKIDSGFNRIVNTRHTRRLDDLLNSTGKVVLGGEVDIDAKYVAPTLVVDVATDSPMMKEEIFGPILPIIPIDSIDDAISFVTSRPKPLALYVFTKSKSVSERVLQSTSSGSAIVNDTLVHVICRQIPFGGVGDSGFGAYSLASGKEAFDAFTHRKGVLLRPLKADPAMRFPPYTQSSLNMLAKTMSILSTVEDLVSYLLSYKSVIFLLVLVFVIVYNWLF